MKKNFSQIIGKLPDQRKKDLRALRKILKANKPKEVKEALVGSQLVYSLPLRFFPHSYNKRPLLYATLANRSGYISLNLISIHNDRKYRAKFAEKLLKTGVCIGASGCCYKIRTVNKALVNLLQADLQKYGLSKFVKTFKKYRQK